jgi:hypothetical protein
MRLVAQNIQEKQKYWPNYKKIMKTKYKTMNVIHIKSESYYLIQQLSQKVIQYI